MIPNFANWSRVHTSFTQVRLVRLPTWCGGFYLNLPASDVPYLVFLEGWLDRTLGITQMVLSEAAFGGNLATGCLLLAPCYNNVLVSRPR